MNCLAPLSCHGKACSWCVGGSTSQSPAPPSSARGTSEMCSCAFCTSGHSSSRQKLGSISLSDRQGTSGWPWPFPRMVPGPQTPMRAWGRAPYKQHYCLPSFLLHGTIKQGTQSLEINTSTERNVYHSMYYSLVYKVFCLYNSKQVLKYDGKCRKTIQTCLTGLVVSF